jgi:hypothetical protein
MKERLMMLPFAFNGTVCETAGTAVFVPPCGLSFRSGAIFVPDGLSGGTVTVTSQATGQGTATLAVTAGNGGSCYIGTSALGWSGIGGTVLSNLYIPSGGSVIFIGSAGTSAGTATQLTGYAMFAIGEG